MTGIPSFFKGKTFDPDKDADRLGSQLRTVYDLMEDGAWRTLGTISAKTGAPEASASARLRDFRRLGMTVERIRIDGRSGLWAYRLITKVHDKTGATMATEPERSL